MIKGNRVTIRTDHKLLLEIVAGTAKYQNSAAADKFHHWRPTPYNTVQERLLKPHCRQLIKVKNRRSLQVQCTTTQQ